MDKWVNRIYLATAVLLALGGANLFALVVVIYPCISLAYLVARYRYLKNLSREQMRHVVPYSHVYTGVGVSAFIVVMLLMSCAMGLYNLLFQ